MSIRKSIVTLTGDAGTSYSIPFAGELHAIYVKRGTLASGAADITISDTETGFVITTITNIAADKMYVPRLFATDLAGADTAVSREVRIPINGTIKFVVAAGGGGNTGQAIVYVEDAQ